MKSNLPVALIKNRKDPQNLVKEGKGFSLGELSKAEISLEIAKKAGLSIDSRRRSSHEENIKIFKDLGFREAPIHMHPEITWQLDITPPEEDLLMKMRKTTRYLIRQGIKNPDLKIIQSKKIEDVEIFNQLYRRTVSRHHFIPFSLDYLKNEFKAFLADNQVSIFFAKYKEEILASAIIIFWQKIAFYHQGASSLKHSKIPGSYLLQWEAIREAKKRGCELYNLWGIAPTDSLKHPWRGLTLFKKGFGGYKKEYIKTQDFVLSKKYWLNYIVEKIRKIKRGL
jgi:lipid II:glycine glycyltransferase (peptidoglycan interpeptide bridge formation enzyme)